MSFRMIVITKFLIWIVFCFYSILVFYYHKKRVLPQSKFSMWENWLKLKNWFDCWIVFVTNNAFYDKSLSFGCKQSFEFNLLDFIYFIFFSRNKRAVLATEQVKKSPKATSAKAATARKPKRNQKFSKCTLIKVRISERCLWQKKLRCIRLIKLLNFCFLW